VVGHLLAAIPGQGSSELLGELADLENQRVLHLFGETTFAEVAHFETVITSLEAGGSAQAVARQPHVAQAHRGPGDLRRAHAVVRECIEATRAGKMGMTGAQAELEGLSA
jgi:hypothetical protein